MHWLLSDEGARESYGQTAPKEQRAEGMQETTHLITIATEAILGKEPTFGHLPQIVLVHEIATVALLAQSPQPMLAYGPSMGALRDRWRWLEILGRWRNVSQGASGA